MSASPANDPSLRSWIDIRPTDDFPIQNLPFGVIETEDYGPHLAVAIGGYALDLYACAQLGFFDSIAADVPAPGRGLAQGVSAALAPCVFAAGTARVAGCTRARE